VDGEIAAKNHTGEEQTDVTHDELLKIDCAHQRRRTS
jgi:hypothetical protein